MSVLLPIIPGTLPVGVCYASEQARLNGFAAQLQSRLDGMAFYNFGSSKPDVAYNAYPWLRTTDMRWYYFDGIWISPNLETSTFARRLFVGTTTDLQTYDGGDATVPSDRSGPMWEVDTDFAGRIPMGPGTLPTFSAVVAVGQNYGSDAVTLNNTQIPATIPGLEVLTNAWDNGGPVGGTERLLSDVPFGSGTQTIASTYTNPSGGEPHENTPQVRGCYIIKRTNRLYYAIP